MLAIVAIVALILIKPLINYTANFFMENSETLIEPVLKVIGVIIFAPFIIVALFFTAMSRGYKQHLLNKLIKVT